MRIRWWLAHLALAALLGGASGGASAQERVPATFRWGLQRPDLVRFNRVEGLSVGARGQIYPQTPMGRTSVTATARLGGGDREANGRIDVTREDLARRVTLSVYHELAAVEEDARHLGLGNSLTALLLGRDDGTYYRRTGASVAWTPPSAERRWFRAMLYAERHGAAHADVSFALRHLGDDSWSFRPNLVADGGWDAGGSAEVAPWWGTDPRRPQGGVTLSGRWGQGDWHYRTVEGGGDVVLPLPGLLHFAGQLRGGAGWGTLPGQRRFTVGGTSTLRGYEPRTLAGNSYLRGRGEVARAFAFGAVGLFSDVAWAGDREVSGPRRALASAGVGLSLADGLIRADAAWGLRAPGDFRLELYLDGIL